MWTDWGSTMFFLTRATACIATVATLVLWNGESRRSLPDMGGGVIAAGLGQVRHLCARSSVCSDLELDAATKAIAAVSPVDPKPTPPRPPTPRGSLSREGGRAPSRGASPGLPAARERPPVLTAPRRRGLTGSGLPVATALVRSHSADDMMIVASAPGSP